MTERAKEIVIHKEMLQTQIKTAETERQTIRSKIQDYYTYTTIMYLIVLSFMREYPKLKSYENGMYSTHYLYNFIANSYIVMRY